MAGQVAHERFEVGARQGWIAIDAQVSADKGPDKPAPDRALVIDVVALAPAAAITPGIGRFSGSQAP
jgi:hypothetical protein